MNLVVQASADVSYQRAGGGKPLVLLHGIGGSHRSWNPIVPYLLPHHDVIALDLPGFGSSPRLPHRSPHTPAQLALVVERLLDGLGLDRPHLAGHSLGAWVAFELAVRGRARAVTAVCPGGLWPTTEPLRVRRRLLSNRFLAITGRRMAPRLLASRTGRRVLLSESSARPADVPLEYAVNAAADVAAATGYLPVYRGTVGRRFTGGAGLRTPIHVLLAAEDRLLPPADNRCGSELPPDTRWDLLSGSGHMALWDSPEEIANAILRDGRDR